MKGREIKALNAFYGSAAGKKELTTRPQLAQHMFNALRERADRIANLAAAESTKK